MILIVLLAKFTYESDVKYFLYIMPLPAIVWAYIEFGRPGRIFMLCLLITAVAANIIWNELLTLYLSSIAVFVILTVTSFIARIRNTVDF